MSLQLCLRCLQPEKYAVSAGAYRVFSCDGSTGANTIIIAAAELAYQDGMDIINLCAPTSIISFALVPTVPLPLIPTTTPYRPWHPLLWHGAVLCWPA